MINVAIDAGHGGENLGCRANGIIEKDWNLEFAKNLRCAMAGSCLFDHVIMTREDDSDPSWLERSMIAKDYLTISIHVNANMSKRASGVQTYVWPDNDLSYWVADSLMNALPSNCANPATPIMAKLNRGDWIERPRRVIGSFVGPCVLLECGFATNGLNARLLKDFAHKRQLIAAIMCGCLSYRHQ